MRMDWKGKIKGLAVLVQSASPCSLINKTFSHSFLPVMPYPFTECWLNITEGKGHPAMGSYPFRGKDNQERITLNIQLYSQSMRMDWAVDV